MKIRTNDLRVSVTSPEFHDITGTLSPTNHDEEMISCYVRTDREYNQETNEVESYHYYDLQSASLDDLLVLIGLCDFEVKKVTANELRAKPDFYASTLERYLLVFTILEETKVILTRWLFVR